MVGMLGGSSGGGADHTSSVFSMLALISDPKAAEKRMKELVAKQAEVEASLAMTVEAARKAAADNQEAGSKHAAAERLHAAAASKEADLVAREKQLLEQKRQLEVTHAELATRTAELLKAEAEHKFLVSAAQQTHAALKQQGEAELFKRAAEFEAEKQASLEQLRVTKIAADKKLQAADEARAAAEELKAELAKRLENAKATLRSLTQ